MQALRFSGFCQPHLTSFFSRSREWRRHFFFGCMSLLISGSLVISGCSEPQEPAPAEEAAAAPTASGVAQRLTDDAFRFAAYEGQLEAVRAALEAGNNVDAADARALTALHMAAYNGHTEVVELLLDHDATIDARDSEGKTPLLHACTDAFPETVALLIARGADINVTESTEAFTPLMTAAGLGQTEIVKLLLEHGANRNALDDDGDSALQHAKNSQHPEIVEILSTP